MLVMIALTYPGYDLNKLILDVWNIEAPSVAAVVRLVREELGPALRRHGRIKAIEQTCEEEYYRPESLGIRVEAARVCSFKGLLADLVDQRGVPIMDDKLLRRCAKSRYVSHVPAQLDVLLTRHGIAGKRGRRQPYRKPELEIDSERPPFLFGDLDDDDPF